MTPEIRNRIAVIFAITFFVVTVDAYNEVKIPRRLELRIDMKSSVDSFAKVYFDMGSGYEEKDSAFYKVVSGKEFQTLYFTLPQKPIYRLRLDPLKRAGEFSILRIGLFDDCHHLIQSINLQAITPHNQIAEFDRDDKRIVAVTKSNAHDPILNLLLDSYPVSLASVYPVKKRVKDIFTDNSSHVGCVFFTVFLITCVAMYFAYSDAEGLGSKS